MSGMLTCEKKQLGMFSQLSIRQALARGVSLGVTGFEKRLGLATFI